MKKFLRKEQNIDLFLPLKPLIKLRSETHNSLSSDYRMPFCHSCRTEGRCWGSLGIVFDALVDRRQGCTLFSVFLWISSLMKIRELTTNIFHLEVLLFEVRAEELITNSLGKITCLINELWYVGQQREPLP